MAAWLLRAFGLLLLLSALALAWSRAPDRPVQSLVARWAPPPSDFIDLKGQMVHLRDEGPRNDPEPIVLVHGTSDSLHTWDGWVKALKPQRRVIRFDLPGFGLTGPGTGAYASADYNGEYYAGFVLDLMDWLKVGRFVIGGNSLGGEVAWRVAARAPERVQQLVLVDAAGPKFVPKSLPLGWRIARVPVLNRLMEVVLPRSMVAQGLATTFGDPTKITPDMVDRYFEMTLREGNRHALVGRLQHYVPGEGAERINLVKAPTLILWGARDQLIPPELADEFARRIAGSRVVKFATLGHVPQLEDPAASVAPVREFLGLK